MHIRIRGECTLVVREPPAGPEKLSFGLPESTFSKILSILESCKKSFPHCGFLSRDRIEATNAFLDRSWHTLVRKIAPVSNEFTDSEISSFLCPIFQLLSLTKLSQISQCSGITLRAVRLYESFPLSPNYSKSREGSTSHVTFFG